MGLSVTWVLQESQCEACLKMQQGTTVPLSTCCHLLEGAARQGPQAFAHSYTIGLFSSARPLSSLAGVPPYSVRNRDGLAHYAECLFLIHLMETSKVGS